MRKRLHEDALERLQRHVPPPSPAEELTAFFTWLGRVVAGWGRLVGRARRVHYLLALPRLSSSSPAGPVCECYYKGHLIDQDESDVATARRGLYGVQVAFPNDEKPVATCSGCQRRRAYEIIWILADLDAAASELAKTAGAAGVDAYSRATRAVAGPTADSFAPWHVSAVAASAADLTTTAELEQRVSPRHALAVTARSLRVRPMTTAASVSGNRIARWQALLAATIGKPSTTALRLFGTDARGTGLVTHRFDAMFDMLTGASTTTTAAPEQYLFGAGECMPPLVLEGPAVCIVFRRCRLRVRWQACRSTSVFVMDAGGASVAATASLPDADGEEEGDAMDIAVDALAAALPVDEDEGAEQSRIEPAAGDDRWYVAVHAGPRNYAYLCLEPLDGTSRALVRAPRDSVRAVPVRSAGDTDEAALARARAVALVRSGRLETITSADGHGLAGVWRRPSMDHALQPEIYGKLPGGASWLSESASFFGSWHAVVPWRPRDVCRFEWRCNSDNTVASLGVRMSPRMTPGLFFLADAAPAAEVPRPTVLIVFSQEHILELACGGDGVYDQAEEDDPRIDAVVDDDAAPPPGWHLRHAVLRREVRNGLLRRLFDGGDVASWASKECNRPIVATRVTWTRATGAISLDLDGHSLRH